MNCAHEVRVKGGTPERTVCAGCGKLLAGGFAVFSDGSAGAARGALEAAAEIGLTIGGWTAADVPAPYAERLRRTLAPRMAARLNVQDSDGTLIVSFAPTLAAGTPAAYADEAAEHQRRPALHIVLPDGGRSSIPEDVRKGVLAWIVEERIATLHITGPRESDEPGIQQAVHDALVWIFEDEVQPRGKFAGVDRAAAPESLRLPDAEVVRIAVEMAEAGGRPTHIAINAEHVDAAIAAGLDVQVVLPGGEVRPIPASTTAPREPPRIDEYVFTNPPPAPSEVWAERDRLLGEDTPAGRVGFVRQLASEGHITHEQARALLEAPQVEPAAPAPAGPVDHPIISTVDTACTDCVRLCFDGVRSKPGGLPRDGIVHATPLDGPDVPLCEIAEVPADGTFTITREEHYRRLRMELPPIGDPDEA